MGQNSPKAGRLRRLVRFLLLQNPAQEGSRPQGERDAAAHQRLESARIAGEQAGRNNSGMF